MITPSDKLYKLNKPSRRLKKSKMLVKSKNLSNLIKMYQ